MRKDVVKMGFWMLGMFVFMSLASWAFSGDAAKPIPMMDIKIVTR